MLSTCIHLLALVLAGRCYPRSPVSPARVLLAPDARPTAHLQKVLLGDVHIRALVGQVVLGFHVLVEDVERHLDEGGVGHPGAIVAVLDFPQLVCLHLQVQCSASGQSGNSWVVLPLPAACLPSPAGAVQGGRAGQGLLGRNPSSRRLSAFTYRYRCYLDSHTSSCSLSALTCRCSAVCQRGARCPMWAIKVSSCPMLHFQRLLGLP